jgi:energy-coupling factor transport system substrate-specific component
VIPSVSRPTLVYVAVVLVGTVAFLWPFLLPAEATAGTAHSLDAPLIAAAVGGLTVVAVIVEIRNGSMNGATVALLGVLAASAGLLRLLNLPGGGSGIFFLIVLAGAAFGPRFGLLLGITAMAVSAVITGGIGPWLPFQMLTLGWMGGGAGLLGRLTRRAPALAEVAVLAVYGWLWGFLYGGIMNLWFWPFVVDGGALSYDPALPVAALLERYAAFYAVTSFGWDAAAALTNAVLIALTGRALLRSMRRFSGRLDPVVTFDDPTEASATA